MKKLIATILVATSCIAAPKYTFLEARIQKDISDGKRQCYLTHRSVTERAKLQDCKDDVLDAVAVKYAKEIEAVNFLIDWLNEDEIEAKKACAQEFNRVTEWDEYLDCMNSI